MSCVTEQQINKEELGATTGGEMGCTEEAQQHVSGKPETQEEVWGSLSASYSPKL